MEDEYFPQPFWFLDAFRTHFKPLPGYTPVNNYSAGEMLSLIGALAARLVLPYLPTSKRV